MPMKPTKDALKPWIITFNQPVNPGTVQDETIYILDENDKRLDVTITVSNELQEVMITPENEYESDQIYTVFVIPQ